MSKVIDIFKDEQEVLERIGACLQHVYTHGHGYKKCQYCSQRNEMSNMIFDILTKDMAELGRKTKMTFTLLDLGFVFEQCLERVFKIEQEISEQQENGRQRKRPRRESSGTSKAPEKTVISIAERKRKTKQKSPRE